MITKTVKYVNFEGNEVTRDFTFHLNKDEIATLNFRENGGTLDEVLITIGQDNTKIREVLEILKEIVVAAVGVRKGDLFIKPEEEREYLLYTDAYSELLFGMLEDPEEAVKFIKAVMPQDISKKYAQVLNGDDLEKLSPEELRDRLKKLESRPQDKPEAKS